MNAFLLRGANSIQRALSWRPARVALILSAFVAYALAYLPLRVQIGVSAGLLASVPLVLGGWFFGLRGGLLISLAIPPLTTLLLNLAGHPGWDASLRETGGLGFLAAVTVGAVIGHWSDLARTLQESEDR